MNNHYTASLTVGSTAYSLKLPSLLTKKHRSTRIALLYFLCFTALSVVCGEEPSLTVYETITGDFSEDLILPELILKVTNPTDRILYVLGLSTADVPHTIEVLRAGKWVEQPPKRCGTLMSFRRFQPQSHLVFTVFDAPLDEDGITFRVRAYLYTTSEPTNIYKDTTSKPYIDVVSEPFHSNDFHAIPDAKTAPAVPGSPRVPTVDPFSVTQPE